MVQGEAHGPGLGDSPGLGDGGVLCYGAPAGQGGEREDNGVLEEWFLKRGCECRERTELHEFRFRQVQGASRIARRVSVGSRTHGGGGCKGGWSWARSEVQEGLR